MPSRSLLIACALPLVSMAATAADRASPRIDEIVVTATRQQQDLRLYAGSISQVKADDVALVGSTHHSEIMNRAAGTMIQRNSGQESLTAIRSPVLSGPGSCASFLFLENSISIRPVGFCNVNELFEINTEQAQAIEVLRGPAGVVYGSGALHGAVNVIAANPAQLPARGFSAEVGPDDFYRGKLAVSGNWNDTALGATAVITDDGGWRKDAGLEEQKLSLSMRRELNNGAFSLHFSGTNLQQETAGFILGRNSYRNSTLARSNQNPEAYRDAYALRLSGHYETELRPGLQLDVRPYVRRSRMDFLQHFLVGKPTEENGQDSLGVLTSLSTSFGSTRVMGGIDLEMAEGFLKETQPDPATDGAPAANLIRPAGKHYDYEVTSNVAAIYGQVEQPIGERWLLSGGLRHEFVEYDYDNRMIAGNTRDDGTLCGTQACLYSRPADRKDDFDNTTARIGVTYALTDAHSLYANATRGYRAPDTSELYRLQRQQSIADLDSERIDSLEIGARGAFGPLRYSLALFTMEKDNVIFRDANAFNVSDGRTDHEGVEYELSWSLLDTLTLTAAGTYAKHTYAFNRAIEGGETIVAGRDVDTAPRHVHTARLDWRFLPSASAELEWVSVGSYWLDAGNANSYGGHDLLNLRVGWSINDQWRTTLRLNNVTDKAYADRADFAFGNYRYFPGRDRTLFAEISYAVR